MSEACYQDRELADLVELHQIKQQFVAWALDYECRYKHRRPAPNYKCVVYPRETDTTLHVMAHSELEGMRKLRDEYRKIRELKAYRER